MQGVFFDPQQIVVHCLKIVEVVGVRSPALHWEVACQCHADGHCPDYGFDAGCSWLCCGKAWLVLWYVCAQHVQVFEEANEGPCLVGPIYDEVSDVGAASLQK